MSWWLSLHPWLEPLVLWNNSCFKRNQNALKSQGRDMTSTHSDNQVPQGQFSHTPAPFRSWRSMPLACISLVTYQILGTHVDMNMIACMHVSNVMHTCMQWSKLSTQGQSETALQLWQGQRPSRGFRYLEHKLLLLNHQAHTRNNLPLQHHDN